MLKALTYVLGGIAALGYIIVAIGLLDMVNTNIATSNVFDWIVWGVVCVFTLAAFTILHLLSNIK